MEDAGMFNPNEHQAACEKYLSTALNSQVRFVGAAQLNHSSRNAPWSLNVEMSGERRRYVLRVDSRHSEHEYEVLRAMESIPIPTPRVYGWDPAGEALGVPCCLYDFIDGRPLLEPMRAGERWAEEVYLDTVCALQGVTRQQLVSIEDRLAEEETAADVLATANEYFVANPHPLAAAVYDKLRQTQPNVPVSRFSNGDLWLENLMIGDRALAGVIDFEHAGFSDPIYEFLLPFFILPELQGRGIEERYCARMGFDPQQLGWYQGLEYFETWYLVKETGEPFWHHTEENLEAALEEWLR